MHPPTSGNRPPRRCRPGFESLELRDLPSSHPLGPALPGKHYPTPDVQQFVPLLYPSGTPQPTPAEVQRESFVVKGMGRYTIGPGRFDTQTLSIHGYGKQGTSNISRDHALPVRDFRADRPHPGRPGNDEPGRRQFPPERGRPDPRFDRADRHRGQRPADEALLDSRRERVELNSVCRYRSHASGVFEFPGELLHRIG